MSITRVYPVGDYLTDNWFDTNGNPENLANDIDDDPTDPDSSFDYIYHDTFGNSIVEFWGHQISGVPLSATARFRASPNTGDNSYVKTVMMRDRDGHIVCYTSDAISISGVWPTFHGYEKQLTMFTPPVGGWDLSLSRLSIEISQSGTPQPLTHYISAFDVVVSGTPPVPSSVPLYIAGHVPATGLDQAITLFEKGHEVAYSGLDLFVKGYDSCDLFMHGHDVTTSGIDLYIKGHEVSTSGLDLYINGLGFASGNLNLYLKAAELSPASSAFNLYMWSTTNSGIQNTIPLFLQCNNHPSELNLFTKGYDVPQSGSMNLYIAGRYDTIANNITLYLNNTGISSGVPLYVRGKGFGRDDETINDNDGYLPVDGSMNLFLNRINEVGTIPMFLKSDFATSGVDLFMEGAFFESGVVPLCIPAVLGITNQTTSLFTHGF